MAVQRFVHVALVVSLGLAASLMAADGPQGTAQPPQQPSSQTQPTFRSGVTAVPIDVRVLGRDGRPVTGLTKDDFAVFEHDVRQSIVHFSEQVLAARPPGPSLRAQPDVPPFDPTPQNQRVFLVVLGAGALGSRPLGPGTRTVADPSKALDGLLHLVRDQLLPQDQVALLANNRATDFSADHERFAKTLEAFRESEEAGLASLERQSIPVAVSSPATSVFPSPPALSTPIEAELGFAEFVNAGTRQTSDFENLYFGVKYLRFIGGEKHLIFVTAHGIQRPMLGTLESTQAKPWEKFDKLAATASNARVALHVIQTGGIAPATGPFLAPLPIMWPRIIVPGQAYFGMGGTDPTPPLSGGEHAPPQPGWDRPAPSPGVPLPGLDATGFQALADLRNLASLTGGRASIMEDATRAVERIDAETRVAYLLAYYPAKPGQDGRLRSIRVEVNRPGVTVRFRHGYTADSQPESLDRRTVIADGRLIAAATTTKPLRDLRITASPTFSKNRAGKGGEIVVEMTIDAARLGWISDDLSRRVAHLDVAIYCGNAKEKVVGQTRRTLNVALTEGRYALATRDGLPYSVRIAVTERPRFVKIIVYNFESDIVGSKVAAVK